MKLENAISKLLTNKIVLYVVFVISLLNIIGYLSFGNITAVAYFIILALLVRYFSKNMIIILLVPLIVVNLYVGSQNQLRNVEGMENNENKNTASKGQVTQSAATQSAATQPSGTQPSGTQPSVSNVDNSPMPQEQFKVKKSNNKLDYSGTLSETYENLNSLLGHEGMQALTNDTKRLMEQQKQLAESMKGLQPLISSFAPLVKQAQGLIGGLGNAGGGNIKGLEGLTEIVNKFGGGNAETK